MKRTQDNVQPFERVRIVSITRRDVAFAAKRRIRCNFEFCILDDRCGGLLAKGRNHNGKVRLGLLDSSGYFTTVSVPVESLPTQDDIHK